MRKIIDGRSKGEVQKKLDKISKDWRQVSEIKIDDSGIGYNHVRYVCVVEAEDKPHSRTNNYWGMF